jgi:hypothetical protein
MSRMAKDQLAHALLGYKLFLRRRICNNQLATHREEEYPSWHTSVASHLTLETIELICWVENKYQ